MKLWQGEYKKREGEVEKEKEREKGEEKERKNKKEERRRQKGSGPAGAGCCLIVFTEFLTSKSINVHQKHEEGEEREGRKSEPLRDGGLGSSLGRGAPLQVTHEARFLLVR